MADATESKAEDRKDLIPAYDTDELEGAGRSERTDLVAINYGPVRLPADGPPDTLSIVFRQPRAESVTEPLSLFVRTLDLAGLRASVVPDVIRLFEPELTESPLRLDIGTGSVTPLQLSALTVGAWNNPPDDPATGAPFHYPPYLVPPGDGRGGFPVMPPMVPRFPVAPLQVGAGPGGEAGNGVAPPPDPAGAEAGHGELQPGGGGGAPPAEKAGDDKALEAVTAAVGLVSVGENGK